MSSAVLEIVELPDGEIVLQRADGDGEPLLNIRFSDESRAYTASVRLEVAKAMIQAGIQALADLTDQAIVEEEMDEEEIRERVIH